jgi:hypothetical protein
MFRISHPNKLRTIQSRIKGSLFVASIMGTASSSSSPWKVEMYTPQAAKWPYTSRDFERQDESPDTEFYDSPKYVTHIDDNAIENLAKYYDAALPKEGKVLDLCSSWLSHYPARLAADDAAIEVYGTGLNQAELDKNKLFGASQSGRRAVQDLNVDPDISHAFPGDTKFNASTCTVSIDYLSQPLAVLSSLRARTAENGTVHLAVSNRAFWHKVVRRWMEVDERGRLEMVGDYLWFAGWREVEIVTIVEKSERGGGVWGMMGKGAPDPLWVVQGRNVPGPAKEHGA